VGRKSPPYVPPRPRMSLAEMALDVLDDPPWKRRKREERAAAKARPVRNSFDLKALRRRLEGQR
jgi:hypothetical protein